MVEGAGQEPGHQTGMEVSYVHVLKVTASEQGKPWAIAEIEMLSGRVSDPNGMKEIL